MTAYIAHNDFGHNYIGHNYIRHNYIAILHHDCLYRSGDLGHTLSIRTVRCTAMGTFAAGDTIKASHDENRDYNESLSYSQSLNRDLSLRYDRSFCSLLPLPTCREKQSAIRQQHLHRATHVEACVLTRLLMPALMCLCKIKDHQHWPM